MNQAVKDVNSEIRVLKQILEQVREVYFSAYLANNSRKCEQHLRRINQIEKQLEQLKEDRKFYLTKPGALELEAYHTARHLNSVFRI